MSKMEIGKTYDLTNEVLHPKDKDKKAEDRKSLSSKIKNGIGIIANNSDTVTSFLTGIYFSKYVSQIFGGKPLDENEIIALGVSAAYSLLAPIVAEKTKVARSLRNIRNAGAFSTAVGYEIISGLIDNIKAGPTSDYVCGHPDGYHDGEDNFFVGLMGSIFGLGGLAIYTLGEVTRRNARKISKLESELKEEEGK